MLDLLETFSKNYELQTRIQPVSAIWFGALKVKTSEGYKNRICAGMKVCIESSTLLPDGEPNCEIETCYANLVNTHLSIDVKDEKGVVTNVKLSLD